MPHAMDGFDALDTGLQCLVIVAGLHRQPADIVSLRHHYSDPGSLPLLEQLMLAAKSLGFKSRRRELGWDELQRCPLPIIARHRDGHFFLIVRVGDERVLIHDPLESRPLSLPRALLEQSWCCEVLLLSHRAKAPAANRRFGFGWFLPAIHKYRRYLYEVLLASFFIQLFALLTPLLFQVIIDKVLTHHSLTTLHVLALALIALAVFEVLLSALRSYLLQHSSYRIDVTLGAELFSHLLALPISYFKQRRIGDTVARVRELDSIRQFITGATLTLVVDLLFTVVFFAVMWFYSSSLSLVVLASLPAYMLLSLLITPLLRGRLDEKFRCGAENQAFLVESITAMETVKSMAVEPQLQRRWEDQLAAYISASFRAGNLSMLANQLAGLINKLVTATVLWLGAYLVIEGQLSVGQLIAFNMLAARLSAPILRLLQMWQELQQARLSVERVGDIFNAPVETAIASAAAMPPLRGDIAFERVAFRYGLEGVLLLDELSFSVAAGEVVGIVGRSGCGKSTLAKLIQRMYTLERGRVLLDGVDVQQLSPAWLRRQVAVVLQDSLLFNATVRDNIALADPRAAMSRIVEAAKSAGAHEFICSLPQGYETVLQEQAAQLSGGQRQRLAIARALLGNPRILIFDEATSALDYESERIIQGNMREICRGRTVLIIAHRLSALQGVDRLLVLENGRIAEQGSHQELVDSGGYYAELVAQQMAMTAVQR